MESDQDAELSRAVKAMASYRRAPPELRERLGAALHEARGETRGEARGETPSRRLWPAWLRAGLQWSLAFACGVLLTLALLHRAADEEAHERLLQNVVASHVRSLMASHLADVASSDQHTVKPWFAGKLDFSPPVRDLAGQGFTLAGGRLDYVAERPVAALVYTRHQHVINLFVWPAAGAAATTSATLSGYHVLAWTEQGMAFWAVSDLDPQQLQAFAAALRGAS